MDLSQMYNGTTTGQLGLQPRQGFTGNINYQGQPISVTNGIADFNGKRFMLGTNGNVTDINGGHIGAVMNGNFIPATR